MKHRPGLILAPALLVLLAACGGAHGSTAHGGSGPRAGAGYQGYRVLALVSAPDGGGVPTTALTWLRDDDEASQFAAQFSPDLEAKLHQQLAAPAVPPGDALFAAVVAVGCDVPTDVAAMAGLNGPMVSTAPVPSPKGSCRAPVTTVAIVSGPVP